ncbi:damage-inducible protein [Stenotrophomonas daejeonensis]|uniref:Damage-inducible protein n=1 Tax=Stenotrophomonas daejeonensis TaxID=659018 RepID=A0A0R0DET0_9GAMM|nr:DinB family protein [Stenotrophomonas daejeonensis]KRG80700.1 damage-inducible protein [Stenotrophomonas daejeonensis]
MFDEAFACKRWTMRRTLEAVRAVDAQAFPAGVAFMRQQLNHIAIVEELFRSRLLGEPAPHAATNTAEVPALEELAARLEASDRWYVGHLAGLAPAQWDEALRFRFADGRDGCMTRREILFHVLNHSSYHRGAIGHALDQAQVPHPADTCTVFLHETQPGRRDGRLPD